jgi:hypothetical protein
VRSAGGVPPERTEGQSVAVTAGALVKGQCPKAGSRPSAARAARPQIGSWMNGATSASATTMMITASPPSNVVVTRPRLEVHHAVHIVSRLGSPPVRHDRSQLPTTGNPFPTTRPPTVREPDREMAGR